MLFGEKKLVAVDIGTSSIKLAEVENSRRGPMLKRFAVYPLNPGLVEGGEIVDIASVSESIAALVKSSKIKAKHAATGLFGGGVIIKKITMPRMEANLVAEQIKWEAEQYIPFDVNEISLEHYILNNRNSNTESLEVLLVAAKQEFVFRSVEAIESAGLSCAVMDISAFALANCFEANYGSLDGTVALLNIGAGITNLVVLDKGEIIFCRDITIGGGIYTNEISKSMGVSIPEAESLKISASLGQEVPAEVNNILSNTNEQVVEEIKNSFEFYSATASGAPIQRLYVSGGSIFVPGLVEQLSKSVSAPYEVFDPFLKMSYDPKTFTAEYISQIKAISPIAMGLALRKPSEKMIRVNLLRSTGMTPSAPAMGGMFSGMGGGGGTSVSVVDQEKVGGLKLVVILCFPILLYAYEYMNISGLETEKAKIEGEAAAIEGKRAAYGDSGPKVEKYTKEKQRIDTQLAAIRDLTKSRLREVKTLDSLQSLTPAQVWFDSIKIDGNLVKASGYSITDEGLSSLFAQLNSSPVFSKFEPKSQTQSTSATGQRTVKFEVEFTIGGRQEAL